WPITGLSDTGCPSRIGYFLLVELLPELVLDAAPANPRRIGLEAEPLTYLYIGQPLGPQCHHFPLERGQVLVDGRQKLASDRSLLRRERGGGYVQPFAGLLGGPALPVSDSVKDFIRGSLAEQPEELALRFGPELPPCHRALHLQEDRLKNAK